MLIVRTIDTTAFLRFGRRAMATQFEVVMPWGTPAAADASTAALDLVDQLEDQLSAFRPKSELSRINAIAAHAPVPVESRLFELLALCARLSRETQGAFDITSSPLSRVWGFHDRNGRVPDDLDIATARDLVGMHHVGLDPARRTVRLAKPGVELNLGSIGKGHALDRAAEHLCLRWRQGCFLIEGGSSSVLAVGAPPDDARGWSVGIRHPFDDRQSIRLHLRDRALGVTGTAHQHFDYNGRRLGHVLDPRTGRPCEQMELAVALAPTAAEADALSTAFFVLGADATAQYCREHSRVAALLLPAGPEHNWRMLNLNHGDFRRGRSPAASPD